MDDEIRLRSLETTRAILRNSKFLNMTVEQQQDILRSLMEKGLAKSDLDMLIAERDDRMPVQSVVSSEKVVIRGPYYLEKLISRSSNRIIYIFYDNHYSPRTCPDDSISIITFIDSLLKENRNYVIDLMLEMNLNHIINPNSKSHLEHLRLLLKDCYSVDRSRCIYPNSRVHWVDVRFGGLLKEYIDTLNVIQQSVKFPPSYFKELGIDIVDFNRRLLNTLRVIDTKFSVDEVLRDSKILKQINNIHDEFVRATLLAEIKNKIRWSHDKFVQLLNRNNQSYVDNRLVRSLLEFTALFMDAYTVGRILRNFGNKTTENMTMDNVVVYTGGAHSHNISHILQKFDYEVVSVAGESIFTEDDDSIQCLDVTEMLPLFSDRH